MRNASATYYRCCGDCEGVAVRLSTQPSSAQQSAALHINPRLIRIVCLNNYQTAGEGCAVSLHLPLPLCLCLCLSASLPLPLPLSLYLPLCSLLGSGFQRVNVIKYSHKYAAATDCHMGQEKYVRVCVGVCVFVL